MSRTPASAAALAAGAGAYPGTSASRGASGASARPGASGASAWAGVTGTERLRIVPPPVPSRSHAPFVLLCAAILLGGLISLLLVNITLANGAYTRHDLTVTRALLAEREQTLRQEVALLEAPQELEVQARALGMVPAPSRAFVRLADGSVSGVPQRAQAGTAPTVVLPLAPTRAPAQPEAGDTGDTSDTGDPGPTGR